MAWEWVPEGWKPRDYQDGGVDFMVNWALNATHGDKQLCAAPTGVGKSYMELEAQRRLGAGWWILTPRLEIARGMLQKLGENPRTLQDLVSTCEKHSICTPIRFRNKLFRGDIPDVRGIIFDEGHHASAQSWQDDWVASGMPPTLLLTATPFRGTSRQTAAFLEHWGEPQWIITLQEAAERRDISIPIAEILPLVDDDIIELNSTGEFDVTALENETIDRVNDLARVSVERWWLGDHWDRVTVLCLPGLASARAAFDAITSRGAAAGLIDAKTPDVARQFLFEALKQQKIALIQISVIGEGVDLPIRRLIDAAPCMSPVKWLQTFGRSTRPVRPNEPPPEFVCTNRNLQRHAYLLEGLIPPTKLAEAVEAFGGIGKRQGYRALGLEALGRFKAVNVELIDGNTASFYFLVENANGRMREFACCAHPMMSEPIWASREHGQENGIRTWGHWKRVIQPTEVHGFVSQAPRPPSEKQVKWWQKQAEWYGLKADVNLTRKNFSALPFCVDIGVRLARKVRAL